MDELNESGVDSVVDLNLGSAPIVDLALLSERELEAVNHMLAGKSSKESAALMGLKDSTVRNYLQRSYKKLGCGNAQELRAALADSGKSVPAGCCVGALGTSSAGLDNGLPDKKRSGRSLSSAVGPASRLSCLFRPCSDVAGSVRYQTPGNRIHIALLMVFALALGFAAGELERGSASLLASFSLVGFLGISAFSVLLVLARKEAVPFLGFVAVCSAMVLCSVLVGVKAGLALGLVAGLCAWFTRCRPLSSGAATGSALVFAAGLIGGRCAIMAWKDTLLYEAYSLAIYGDATTASAFIPAMAVLLLALGGICVVVDSVLFAASAQADKELQRPAVKEKTRLYFASQGLGELEAAVLLLILAGDTGPVIAQKLNYSYGAVNNARDTAYKALDIHSKQELARLVDEHILHVDRGGQPSS